MKARNVSVMEMQLAMHNLNKRYADNVIFNRFDTGGKVINFTLKVKDSSGPGARVHADHFGATKKDFRRSTSACWHVHGHFFEALLAVNPGAVVISMGTARIDIDGGNWQDRNIGSMAYPLMYSESCNCDGLWDE